MNATYKECRRLSATSLRSLCISKNWYTSGDNEEYSHLLHDLAGHKTNLCTEDIIGIAEDIFEHTASKDLDGYGVEDIAFEVNRVCTVTFGHQ